MSQDVAPRILADMVAWMRAHPAESILYGSASTKLGPQIIIRRLLVVARDCIDETKYNVWVFYMN